MEELCLRFCHVSGAIFEEIDNKSLNECRKVNSSFCASIDSQKLKWIRIIAKCIGKIDNFQVRESWKKVLNKVPTKIVKKLSQVVQRFFIVRPSRHKHQWTPLHIAAERGHLSLCKYITKKYLDRCPDGPSDRLAPFYLAAQNGHWRVCKFLISMVKDVGILISIRNGVTVTPLHAAAMNGHVKVCQMIIDNIADKNPKDDNAWTPLHSAAKRGHLEVCKIIIANITKKNPADNYGETPLHGAATAGHFEVCRLLLENITEKNPGTNYGWNWTPLHNAAHKNHVEICKLFFEHVKDKNPHR